MRTDTGEHIEEPTDLDADNLRRAMQNANEVPAEPQRPRAPIVVDSQQQEEQKALDYARDENERLAVQALLHQAWSRELVRKRGFAPVIGARDMQALEHARKAFELIPDRNPEAV